MFDCIRTVSCSGLRFFKEKKKKAALATLWFVLAWHDLLSWIRKTKSVLLGFCFRADLSGESMDRVSRASLSSCPLQSLPFVLQGQQAVQSRRCSSVLLVTTLRADLSAREVFDKVKTCKALVL